MEEMTPEQQQAVAMANARLRLQQTKATPTIPEEADIADKIMGHPATRFALGAASPFIASFQAGANVGDKLAGLMGLEPVVGKSVNEWVARVEDMKRRGMAARSGNKVGEDWDVAGTAGAILNPVGLSASKGIPAAKTIGEKIIQGSKTGATYGALTPVMDVQDDFLANKAMQIGTGATIGGVIPGVIGTTQATG